MKKRYVISILFCFFAMISVAQESENVEVQFHCVDDCPVAVVGGVYYATKVESLDFYFTLPEYLVLSDIENITCTFAGKEKKDPTIDNRTCSFTYLKDEIGTPIGAKATILIKPRGGEAMSEKSKTISIYEDPNWNKNEEELTTLCCSHSDRIIDITNYAGGYPSGWRVDNEEMPNGGKYQKKIVKPQGDIPNEVPTTIKIQNIAPDGETPWYDKTVTLNTYFYDIPDPQRDGNGLEKSHFYKNTNGYQWTFKGLDKGNPTGWKVKWNNSDEPGEKTYCPCRTDVAKDDTLQIHAALMNEYRGQQLYPGDGWAPFDFGTIYVYKEVKYDKSLVKNQLSIYKGESVSFSVTGIDGGCPEGWDAQYTDAEGNSIDCNLVKEGGFKKATISVSPTETTTYTLKVFNTLPEETIPCDSIIETFTATVYDAPEGQFTENFVIKKVNGEVIPTVPTPDTPATFATKEQDYPTGEPIELMVDDQVYIDFEPADGEYEFAAWKKDIYVNDTLYTDGMPINVCKGLKKIRLVISNGVNIVNAPRYAVFERDFNVLEKPNHESKTDTITINTYAGCTKDPLPSDGGKRTWTDENGNKVTPKIPESLTERKDSVYKGTFEYEIGGHVRLSVDNQLYKIVVYPKPEITDWKINLHKKAINKRNEISYYDRTASLMPDTIECFNNDVLDINYHVKGGYLDGTQRGWHFSIDGENKTIDCSNPACANGNDSIPYTAKCSDEMQPYTDKPLTLRILNMPPEGVVTNDSVWLEDSIKIVVRSWHAPQITPELKDSVNRSWASYRVDVYAGGYEQNKVKFLIPHEFGYTGKAEGCGWTYEWRDGEKLVSTNDSLYVYTPSTSTSKREDHDFKLHVVNRIGDNYSVDDTLTYKVRVWPEAELADNITVQDMGQPDRGLSGDEPFYIRSGNTLLRDVKQIQGGYEVNGAYGYNWSEYLDSRLQGSKNESVWSAPVKFLSSETKDFERIYGNCVLRVWGPNNNPWEEKKFQYSYIVFNKPETPTSLMIKGSGVSGTLICTADVSDEDLEGREYWLAFGYKDGNNDVFVESIRQTNPGLVRWSTGLKELVNSHRDDIFVCAVWYYPEFNIPVTSGKCTLSGVDENWDGSFKHIEGITTRSSIGDTFDGIEEVYSDAPNRCAVYNMSGLRVNGNVKGLVIKNGKKYFVK